MLGLVGDLERDAPLGEALPAGEFEFARLKFHAAARTLAPWRSSHSTTATPSSGPEQASRAAPKRCRTSAISITNTAAVTPKEPQT